MRKHLCLVSLALIGVGIMLFSIGPASADDVVDKLELLAVKSIQVRIEDDATYLDITTLIANANAEPLKVRDRELTFFISPLHQGDEAEPVFEFMQELGTEETREEVMLKPQSEMLLLTPEGANEVEFHVDMGRREEHIMRSLAHLLNALGFPARQAPLLTVSGRADVGMLSQNDQQWKFKPGRIEWNLQPKVQPRFLLYYGASE